MSKKQKEDSTPASENFVSIASPSPLADFTATSTVNVPASSIPQSFSAEVSSLGVTGNVSGKFTSEGQPQSCYIPIAPFIGDTIPDYSGGFWEIPKPWHPNTPSVPWNPVSPSVPNTFLPTPRYWGVQRISIDGSDSYYVVPPSQLTLGATNIVARTETESDARLVADALNQRAHPAKSVSEDYNLGNSKSMLGRLLTQIYAKNILQKLMGRILTIIDASIPAEAQNKAMKSVLKREFRQSMTEVHNYAYGDVSEGEELAEESLSD